MKLKICGMKLNTEEVATLQPDYLGFIFWEPSSRYFKGSIPDDLVNAKKVGVFVNAPLEEIVLRLFEYDLHAIQLHGEEDPEYCRKIKTLIANDHISKIEIIKAFAVDEQFNFNMLSQFENVCDYFLFDTRGILPGGTGKKFDWQLLGEYPSKKPYFLSGGIGSSDAKTILDFMSKPEAKYCHSIDINSKFESEPGLKNIQALKKFTEDIGHVPSKK